MVQGFASLAGRERRGMWAHLTEKIRARSRLEVTREQNRSTKDDIEALADGGYLFESEPGGRTRIIHRPGPVGGARLAADSSARAIIDAEEVRDVSPARPDAELPTSHVPILGPDRSENPMLHNVLRSEQGPIA